MGIYLQEHRTKRLRKEGDSESTPEDCFLSANDFQALSEESFRISFFRKQNNQVDSCFTLSGNGSCYTLQAGYYVGMDWLGKTERYICVEPKVNAKMMARYGDVLAAETEEDFKRLDKDGQEAPENLCELDFLRMLLEVMAVPEAAENVSELVQIDFNAKPIPIPDIQDHLTPFLVVQFLQLLRSIVRKGLRKGYYKVTENLTNRVKGKILVGQHLRQNVFKNRFTQTLCEYQVFGIDTPENRFLKKVLQFAAGYVENQQSIFGDNLSKVQHLIYYARPAFEWVGDAVEMRELRQVKPNPLFREYGEAIKIGGLLLRRFGYNISKTISGKEATVPPFWIDMPGLFERYVYAKLLEANPETKSAIHFQFPTYGNKLDFLISDKDHPMVIDTKYKERYKTEQDVHADIRQVSGYARLKRVITEVAKSNKDFKRDEMMDCLIIYPDPTAEETMSFRLTDLLQARKELKAYYKVYKLGVPIPFQERY